MTSRLTLNASLSYLILIGVGSVLRGLIYTVAAVYYVEVVHMNPLQLVLVGTVLETTVLIFEVPTGAIADTFSRRTAVVLGQLFFGVAFILEGEFPLVVMILIAEAIRGIGESFNSGALEALVAGEVGDANLGQVLLRGAQISRLGFLVGIGASVGLASIQLNVPIVCGGVLSVGLGVASEGVDRLWEAHFLTNFLLPPLGRFKPVVWFGIIEAGAMVLGIAAIALVRHRVNIEQHPAIARALFVLTALRMVATWTFALSWRFPVALLAYWGVSVTRGIGEVLLTTWLTREIEPRIRATVLSIAGQADAFGQVAVGPVIDAIGVARSLRAALVAAEAVLVPALGFFQWFSHRGAAKVPVHDARSASSFPRPS